MDQKGVLEAGRPAERGVRIYLARFLVTLVAVGVWFWTQSLIGSRPLPGSGLGDGMHNLLAPVNLYLQAHPAATNALLIVSSFFIDALALFLLGSWIFGPTARPLLGLVLVLALRQLMQVLVALPAPPGMIWHDPGFPSLLVTYGVANDFFFSGHTAVAVLGAVELARRRQRWLTALAAAIVGFEVLTVLALRAHYTMDIFAGILAALGAAYVSERVSPTVDHRLNRAAISAGSIPALLIILAVPTLCTAQSEPLRPDWCRQLPRPAYKALERMRVDEGWFEVYRVRPGVFAIYEPRQFEEVISYLIVGSKRGLLFDTGLGVGRISEVVRKLTKLPVTVINSHTHFDHTGGNAEFQNILGMDTDYTRRSAEGGLDPFARDLLAPERLCSPLPKGVQGPVPTRAFRVARFLHDGERIDLGGRTLEVVATPGHTPDSLCLLDRKNRLLFTGDTFYLGPIYLFTEETDFAAYTKSVQRLAALAPALDVALTAHNVPAAEPRHLVNLAEAVRKVHSGEATAKAAEGRREYDFGSFSLLVGADPIKSK